MYRHLRFKHSCKAQVEVNIASGKNEEKYHILKVKIINLVRVQGVMKTIIILILLILNKLLNTKIINRMRLTFRCSHGYTFIARIEDWWRFTNHFEPRTTAFIGKIIKSNDIVIDVGAHIGIHTVHFAKKAKFVIAIEPEPENFLLLKMNILANKIRNVIALPIAASNYDGAISLCISSASGAHTVEETNKCINKLMVKCKRIDSLLKVLGISKVDIVKIDVEGHEYKVIGGMREILTKNPPRVLIMEVNRNSKLLAQLNNIFKHVLILDIWNNRLNIALIRDINLNAGG